MRNYCNYLTSVQILSPISENAHSNTRHTVARMAVPGASGAHIGNCHLIKVELLKPTQNTIPAYTTAGHTQTHNLDPGSECI